MSDIVGGKAIALVQAGGIEEVKHARTFKVKGGQYHVTFGLKPTGSVPRYSCDCPATGRCYHGEAASLVMAKERAERQADWSVSSRARARRASQQGR